MKLQCYALHDFAPRLIAAPAQRQWMDEFVDRHAYRCLPLSIANAHGWEALCPAKIEVEWNGGSTVEDLAVRALTALPGGQPIEHFCRSNFSRGIVTFHLDYIFRTDAGWDLLATGPLNHPKENAYPLTGIIETDWLPYPFTMNWQITKPGRVVFEEGEPFCFLFPVKKQALLDCEPEILRLSDNAELTRQHDTFRLSRDEFMKRFHAGDDATIKQAWQRHYFLGRHPDGAHVDGHINKLRLKEPVDCRKGPVMMGALTRVAPAQLDAAIKRTDSKWEDRSLLNAIERDQSDHNEAGRRRIDRAGHLVNWNNTYIVRSNNDAFGHDFLVVDDLLTAEQCDTLCRAFWDLVDRTHKSDEIDPFWNNRFIWFADVKVTRPAAGEIMIDALQRAIELVKRFYLLRAPVYPDLLQIVKWDSGIFMLPHADNANPDGTEHMMPYRELAGIVYLNDDYEGGELYFTAHDIAIKPRRGMFVGFTAGFHHEHAVLRVDSGTRLTMPFFLAFDSEKADRTLLQYATA